MIRCQRDHLEARCMQRGYTLSEVLPCVVAQDGDEWTVDIDHPAYPRAIKQGFPATGTELKKLLAGWPFYLRATEACPCHAYAQQMDAWGPDECERRIDEIVAHLREQAAARGLPFIDAAGRMLVRRAIRNARKT